MYLAQSQSTVKLNPLFSGAATPTPTSPSKREDLKAERYFGEERESSFPCGCNVVTGRKESARALRTMTSTVRVRAPTQFGCVCVCVCGCACVCWYY